MTAVATAAPDLWDGRRRVISALGITQILGWGSSYYVPAVLGHPIAAATGWPYGWVIGGLSLGLLVSGLVSIRVGHLIDRHGGRPVLVASSLFLAAGLVLLAFAPSVPVYLCAWLVLGLGMGSGLYDAAFSTLGRLYGHRARPAITTLTLWGGFASTVCWPLSAFLVEQLGWRGTCLAYAALHLAVTLPLHLFVIPDERGRPVLSQLPPGAAPPSVAPGRRAVLAVLLGAIVTLAGVIAASWSVHIITMLQAGGLGLAAAVGLGALVGPAQVAARIVEMAGRGRHHPIWTLAAAVVLTATGLVLLWGGFALLAVALIAYGAGNGIFSIARGTLPLALFGSHGYARLMGRLAMPSLIAQALAPSGAALLVQTGGAHLAFGVLAALACANVVLMVALWGLARPPGRR